jgi:hypothetical protein
MQRRSTAWRVANVYKGRGYFGESFSSYTQAPTQDTPREQTSSRFSACCAESTVKTTEHGQKRNMQEHNDADSRVKRLKDRSDTEDVKYSTCERAERIDEVDFVDHRDTCYSDSDNVEVYAAALDFLLKQDLEVMGSEHVEETGIMNLFETPVQQKRCTVPSKRPVVRRYEKTPGAVLIVDLDDKKIMKLPASKVVTGFLAETQRLAYSQNSVLSDPEIEGVLKSGEILRKCLATNKWIPHKLFIGAESQMYGMPTFSIQPLPTDKRNSLAETTTSNAWVKFSHGGNCTACSPTEVKLDEPSDNWKAFYSKNGQTTGIYYKTTNPELTKVISRLNFEHATMGHVFQSKRDYSKHRSNSLLSKECIDQMQDPIDKLVSGLAGMQKSRTLTAELLVTSRPAEGEQPDVAQKYHRDFLPAVAEKLGTMIYVIFCSPMTPVNCTTDAASGEKQISQGSRRIGVKDLYGEEYNIHLSPGVSLAMQGGVIHRGLPVEQDNAVLVSYVATDANALNHTNLDKVNDILFEDFKDGICKD